MFGAFLNGWTLSYCVPSTLSGVCNSFDCCDGVAVCMRKFKSVVCRSKLWLSFSNAAFCDLSFS